MDCVACSPSYRNWRDGALSLPFVKGGDKDPQGDGYYWQLGAPPNDRRNWHDRGVTILYEDMDGEYEEYRYMGLSKNLYKVAGDGDDELEEGEIHE